MKDRRAVLRRAEVLFCATGNRSLSLSGPDKDDLKNGVYIASCTSHDDEFDMACPPGTVVEEDCEQDNEEVFITRWVLPQPSGLACVPCCRGKVIHFLYGGDAVNFVYAGKTIQQVYGVQAGLLWAAISLLVGGDLRKPARIKYIPDIPPSESLRILEIWRRHFGAFKQESGVAERILARGAVDEEALRQCQREEEARDVLRAASFLCPDTPQPRGIFNALLGAAWKANEAIRELVRASQVTEEKGTGALVVGRALLGKIRGELNPDERCLALSGTIKAFYGVFSDLSDVGGLKHNAALSRCFDALVSHIPSESWRALSAEDLLLLARGYHVMAAYRLRLGVSAEGARDYSEAAKTILEHVNRRPVTPDTAPMLLELAAVQKNILVWQAEMDDRHDPRLIQFAEEAIGYWRRLYERDRDNTKALRNLLATTTNYAFFIANFGDRPPGDLPQRLQGVAATLRGFIQQLERGECVRFLGEGPAHLVRYAQCYSALANVHFRLGEDVPAVKAGQEAFRIFTNRCYFPERHPTALYVSYRITASLLRAGRLDQARQTAEETVRLSQEMVVCVPEQQSLFKERVRALLILLYLDHRDGCCGEASKWWGPYCAALAELEQRLPGEAEKVFNAIRYLFKACPGFCFPCAESPRVTQGVAPCHP